MLPGNALAALTDFDKNVQHQAGPGSGNAVPLATSHVVRNILITLGAIRVAVALGFFLIACPIP